MKKIDIPASSGRLINAVASMGYDREAALCDLMDNCIDASSHIVNVVLSTGSKSSHRRATINRYVIADDGLGMDKQELINAFTLGSVRDYPKNALGKFGIGLKSASLSLAKKIIIVTKKPKQTELICGILSIEEVEKSDIYAIDLGTPPKEYSDLWMDNAPNPNQGTLLILDHPIDPPYADFIDYFQRYCSSVYHLFMQDKDRDLSIRVNNLILEPLDPLFLEEAKENGPLAPDTWSGKTPHVLLDHKDPFLLDDGTTCEIAAAHLIHPPSFGEEKRPVMRDKYNIEPDPYTKRPRHGFYVYRNKRIIVMAELFRGLVSREYSAWAFRARIMFDESADHIMSLDVKKRHCSLPSKARKNLEVLIRPYVSKSIKAWKEAGRRYTEGTKKNKEDLANESISKSPVSKTDYAPGIEIKSEDDLTKRKKRQDEISKGTLSSIQDESITKEVLEKKAKEHSAVIPVKGLKSNAMWDVYPSSQFGTVETLVNEYHSWVSTAYEAADSDARITVILHQFFYILARAELEVRSNDWNLSISAIEKTFNLFRRKASNIAEDLAENLEEELKTIRDEFNEE